MQITVFHYVHENDLNVALKFNCDYRRYKMVYSSCPEGVNKQPKFINSLSNVAADVSAFLTKSVHLLVLSKIEGTTTTQCDYYIRYVVHMTRN